MGFKHIERLLRADLAQALPVYFAELTSTEMVLPITSEGYPWFTDLWSY